MIMAVAVVAPRLQAAMQRLLQLVQVVLDSFLQLRAMVQLTLAAAVVEHGKQPWHLAVEVAAVVPVELKIQMQRKELMV